MITRESTFTDVKESLLEKIASSRAVGRSKTLDHQFDDFTFVVVSHDSRKPVENDAKPWVLYDRPNVKVVWQPSVDHRDGPINDDDQDGFLMDDTDMCIDINEERLTSLRTILQDNQQKQEIVHNYSTSLKKVVKLAQQYAKLAEKLAATGDSIAAELQSLQSPSGEHSPVMQQLSGILGGQENLLRTTANHVRTSLANPLEKTLQTEGFSTLEQYRGKMNDLSSDYDRSVLSQLGKRISSHKKAKAEATSTTKLQEKERGLTELCDTYTAVLSDVHVSNYQMVANQAVRYVIERISLTKRWLDALPATYESDLPSALEDDIAGMFPAEPDATVQAPSTGHQVKQCGFLLLKKGKGFQLRWFEVENGVCSWFRRWKDAKPMDSINLLLCTVRTLPQRRASFEIRSPHRSLICQALNPGAYELWVSVLRNNISDQLDAAKKKKPTHEATENYLNKVVEANPSNAVCVDCGADAPTWASINVGAVICHECSGIHRKLGVHISKIRSLTLDEWEPETLEILMRLGNDKVNAFFAARLEESPIEPLSPEAGRADREAFIEAKYSSKLFMPVRSETDDLTADVLSLIQASDMLQLSHRLAHGLSPSAVIGSEERNLLHHAAATGDSVLVEYLIQNESRMNRQDATGSTPLHLAAAGGHAAAVRILLLRGANADLENLDGKTPIQLVPQENSELLHRYFGGKLEPEPDAAATLTPPLSPSSTKVSAHASASADELRTTDDVAAADTLDSSPERVKSVGSISELISKAQSGGSETNNRGVRSSSSADNIHHHSSSTDEADPRASDLPPLVPPKPLAARERSLTSRKVTEARQDDPSAHTNSLSSSSPAASSDAGSLSVTTNKAPPAASSSSSSLSSQQQQQQQATEEALESDSDTEEVVDTDSDALLTPRSADTDPTTASKQASREKHHEQQQEQEQEQEQQQEEEEQKTPVEDHTDEDAALLSSLDTPATADATTL